MSLFSGIGLDLTCSGNTPFDVNQTLFLELNGTYIYDTNKQYFENNASLSPMINDDFKFMDGILAVHENSLNSFV